jgi:hypothetical protein
MWRCLHERTNAIKDSGLDKLYASGLAQQATGLSYSPDTLIRKASAKSCDALCRQKKEVTNE